VSAPFVPALDTFAGGQMTDLPVYNSTGFDGTELFEIVAPGNPNLGVNYSITSSLLAILLNAQVLGTPTIITSGATLGSPYNVLTSDTRILFNKTISSASYAVLGASSLQPIPVFFKDLKGDAATNPITISFTGGQLCDGLSTMVINSAYGWLELSPLASGGWYQSA